MSKLWVEHHRLCPLSLTKVFSSTNIGLVYRGGIDRYPRCRTVVKLFQAAV